MLKKEAFNKGLATLISKRRKELRWTNENIADESKIDTSKISQLQNNKAGCNGYTLYKLLYAFGYDILDSKKQNLKNINSLLKECDKKQLDMIVKMVNVIKNNK